MFEYNLLTWLVTIFLVNLSLLYFAWKIYGPRINVHILKKDEKDLIFDQLRKEALELKLPKEHTPRI